MQWLYFSFFLLICFDIWPGHRQIDLRGLVRTDGCEQRERENWGNNACRRKKGMYRESDPCFPAAECLYPQSVKEHLSVLVGHSFPCFLSSLSSFISVLDGKHHSLLSFLSSLPHLTNDPIIKHVERTH